MTTILGLSGSLRAGSFNSALLRTAAASMPAGATLEIGSIKGIPLYDADVGFHDDICVYEPGLLPDAAFGGALIELSCPSGTLRLRIVAP